MSKREEGALGTLPDGMPFLILEQIYESMYQDSGPPGYRSQDGQEQLLAIALASKGLYEKHTRKHTQCLVLTNKTGAEIADVIDKCTVRTRIHDSWWPFSEQVEALLLEDCDYTVAYSGFEPSFSNKPTRYARVLDLIPLPNRPVGELDSESELAFEEAKAICERARMDLEYAYSSRGHVDGDVLVAACLCPNLVRLQVNLCPPLSVDHQSFSNLLMTKLRADEANRTVTWPGLKHLHVTLQGDQDEILLPSTVVTCTLRNCKRSTTTIKILGPGPSRLEKLAIEGGDAPGNLVATVNRLICSGTVPHLKRIEVRENEIDPSAALVLLDTCRGHLLGVEHIVLDLTYRSDDYHNRDGSNDDIAALNPMPANCLRSLPHLKSIALARSYVWRWREQNPLERIAAVINHTAGKLEHFGLLGSFREDLQTIYCMEGCQLPCSWSGQLLLGIDVDETSGTDLPMLLSPSRHILAQITQYNLAKNIRCSYEIRNIGQLNAPSFIVEIDPADGSTRIIAQKQFHEYIH